MHTIFAAAVFGFTMASTAAFAGPGHSHAPVTQEAVAEMAVKKRDQLVSAKKLDRSWSGAAVSGIEQKTFAKGPEWVISFRNDVVADQARRTLYMFYALDGHFLAANFSGK